MERKSSFDFFTPQRQSYVAILIIVLEMFRKIIRQIWPVVLVLFINTGRGSMGDRFILLLSAIGLVSGILSIISFFKYYFYVDEDELIVERGILRKSKTSIPFDRIQTINFEQEIMHRVFNVAKLKIDTAGSTGSELSLHALSWPMANALKDHVLSQKSGSSQNTNEIEGIEEQRTEKEIMKVDLGSLLKIGATENHLRSGLVILAFGFWMFDQLREVGLGGYVDRATEGWELILSSMLTVGILASIFAIAAFSLSLVRTVFRYFDLRLVREESGFKVIYGLFNRRQTSAKDKKIQTISWSQNWLQKKVGLYEVFLRQASSREVRARRAITVPGCDRSNVFEIQQYLLRHTDYLNSDDKAGVSKHYFWYAARNSSIILLAAAAVLWYVGNTLVAIFFGLFLIYTLFRLYLRWKKKGYVVFNDAVAVKGGSFGAKHTILENHKIQSIQLKESLYQRFRGLASLELSTAGGTVMIPFLEKKVAQQLLDYLLYRVESSAKAWM